MYFVATVVLGSKGVSFVSACRVDLAGVVVRGGLLVWALTVVFVVTMGLCVVDDVVDELDIPGSMSSFGFIENPVRVEFFTGEIAVLRLSDGLVTSSGTVTAVLYPVIAIENFIFKEISLKIKWDVINWYYHNFQLRRATHVRDQQVLLSCTLIT